MGKVKKLRKKYKAYCTKTKNETESLAPVVSESSQSKTSTISEILQNNGMDLNNVSVARSTCSVSKSILSGSGIPKKDKQKIRRELFLEKLEISKKMMNMSKKKGKKIFLHDNLPPLEEFTGQFKNNKESFPKIVKSEMKKRHQRKGMMKRRNIELVQNANSFKDILTKKILVKEAQ